MKSIHVPPVRLDSIDVFRAVTMFIMIFVNDLWTLEDVPGWLQHSAAEDDAMGLSDVVFPAFLFIVGLSIPFAICGRKARGETWIPILTHIFERTFALLIMGFFIVNLENTEEGMMLFPPFIWEIFMVVAFFMIYNYYPPDPAKHVLYNKLYWTGWIILVFLAVTYKGGEPEDPSWLETHWWGILGLIGWSYFLCAPLYLFIGDRIKVIAGCYLFFVLFNLIDFAGMPDFLNALKPYIWIVGSGSMPAFVMAGMCTTVFYREYGPKIGNEKFTQILLLCGVVLCVYGFGTKPFWGISKIRATPAWVGICTGISFLLFAFFFWLVDMKRNISWATWIKPAGTATLTCYLIPYLCYAFNAMTGFGLPVFLRAGAVGLVRSFLFALLVVWVTGKLNRRGVKLKI